jgi:predicted MarR family transcription regulator
MTGPAPSHLGPIVSSGHLASGALPALSEFEFGMIMTVHAFNRWMVRCMAAAGRPGMSATEILILHTVRHRERPKRLADILLVLDIEDAHVATYAIRKLEDSGLVATGRAGKEKLVAATEAGAALCAAYAEVRERLLARPLRASGPAEAHLSEMAQLMRTLSGFYDQAARAAATL